MLCSGKEAASLLNKWKNSSGEIRFKLDNPKLKFSVSGRLSEVFSSDAEELIGARLTGADGLDIDIDFTDGEFSYGEDREVPRTIEANSAYPIESVLLCKIERARVLIWLGKLKPRK